MVSGRISERHALICRIWGPYTTYKLPIVTACILQYLPLYILPIYMTCTYITFFFYLQNGQEHIDKQIIVLLLIYCPLWLYATYTPLIAYLLHLQPLSYSSPTDMLHQCHHSPTAHTTGGMEQPYTLLRYPVLKIHIYIYYKVYIHIHICYLHNSCLAATILYTVYFTSFYYIHIYIYTYNILYICWVERGAQTSFCLYWWGGVGGCNNVINLSYII